MFQIFQYQFIINSLIIGSLVAIVAPIIGTFLVVKRFSAFSDTIAHTSLVGIVIGLILKVNPIISAIITAVLTALSIETIRKNQKNFNDSILVLFMTGGLGLSTILISLNKNSGININNYLFGSINTITNNDIWLTLGVSILVISLIIWNYKGLFQVAFDEEMAATNRIPVDNLNRLFIVIAALVVSISIQTIGVLLISSLMIIPVLTSLKFRQGFFITIILSSIIGIISVWLGIIGSFYLNIATGGLIVMVNIGLYVLASLSQKVKLFKNTTTID
jgi:zinc transport system permease protein